MSDVPRDELVERLIASDAKCRMLERTLREIVEHDTNVSYLLALQATIARLEANVQTLAKKRGAK